MIGVIPDDAGCWACGVLNPEFLVPLAEALEAIPLQIAMVMCSPCGDQINDILRNDPSVVKTRLFEFMASFPSAIQRVDFAMRAAHRCANGLFLVLYQRRDQFRFVLIDPTAPYGINVASCGN